ncbi:hypothetical protein CATMIT_00061 [Catenibacterium mitsuokai DSM 15897]|nr:hypothetical protein CATMIT_00061 [Catenibacterium mitsuokai DSM 15897]
MTPATSQISLTVIYLKSFFARIVRKASSILAAVAKYLLSDLFNHSHLLSCYCLLLTDFFCQFHDFKSVFLLALSQQFFVDGVINAHTQQPDNADNHSENKHTSTTVADNLHGKAHPNTSYHRTDNTECVGKNSCGKLGFYIQLAKSDHLSSVLGCIFVCELFCIDFICIHDLFSPSFEGSMIPAKNEQRNNTDCSLC